MSATHHSVIANSNEIIWTPAHRPEIIWHSCSWVVGGAYRVYEYAQIKARKSLLHRDLVEELFHPRRIAKHLYSGKDLDEYLP